MSELCDEALANLYPFLDSELEIVQVQRIKAHLDDCPPCWEVFGFEERLKRVVRERLAEEVPHAAMERFRAALREARRAGG